MRYILAILGTISTVTFIIFLKRGRQYEAAVKNLDENRYPLHDLYVAGFAWGKTKLLSFQNSMVSKLKIQAGLLYNLQYAEYYANLAWSQMITLVQLFGTITILMAAIMYQSVVFVLFAGGFLTLIVGVYSYTLMENDLASRTQQCEGELPEVVSTMAILVNSGMMLREAWSMVCSSREGAFYDLMRRAEENMKNGHSDSDAIFLFGKESNSVEIKKFASALLQSMEKGGGELGTFLAQQSSELWEVKRQRMLQAGEKAATKLLLPILIIFAGVIIIVITAAFAGALF
ncbi:MAG: type II secretion system F family protein [Lachnospiraceae bacterium]|nr:type II secretion system F family protein [Lachnospiraceae bacterium]